jgi:hypothetical protein
MNEWRIEENDDDQCYRILGPKGAESHDGDGASEVVADVYDLQNVNEIVSSHNKRLTHTDEEMAEAVRLIALAAKQMESDGYRPGTHPVYFAIESYLAAHKETSDEA